MSDTTLCVGAVVRQNDSVLLVRQSAGHSLEGLWTIPWGQVADGESPTAAAVRETAEEANIVARVDGLLGVQELPDPWPGMIGIIFLCSHVNGSPIPDSRETDGAKYFSIDALEDIADTLEPLSAWLVRRVLAGDYQISGHNESGPFSPSPTYL